MSLQKSPSSEFSKENESPLPDEFEKESPERQDDNQGKLSKIEPTNDEDLCRKDLESSITTDFMNVKEEIIKILVEDCRANKQTCETGPDEMIKPKSQTQFGDNLVSMSMPIVISSSCTAVMLLAWIEDLFIEKTHSLSIIMSSYKEFSMAGS